jgi:hypothetical protein
MILALPVPVSAILQSIDDDEVDLDADDALELDRLVAKYTPVQVAPPREFTPPVRRRATAGVR